MLTLTPDELHDLTGYQRACAQRRWLTARGFVFEVRANGTPAVLRAHVERRMGAIETAPVGAAEPDWSAL
jgi:hypothetical protein